MLFKDKSVLITGSTRNTGLEIARMFVEEGAFVFVNGRQAEDVDKAVAELNCSVPNRALSAVGDISKPLEVEAIYETIRKEKKPIEILINNACHLGLGHSFLDTPLELFESVIDVNLKGLFLCSQIAAQTMVEEKGGSIINIGSVTASRAIRGRFAYIASKGGIESATRSMALELAPFNIRVNCVVPGHIHTSRWDNLDDKTLSIRRASVPLGVEAFYDDVANAVKYLASDLSKNITGTRLVVDGGWSIQASPEDLDV